MKTAAQIIKEAKAERKDKINRAIIKGIQHGDKLFHQDYDRMIAVKTALREAGFQIVRKKSTK